MLRHYITSIDYAKLISMQANNICGKVEKEKNNLKPQPKAKIKTKLFKTMYRK